MTLHVCDHDLTALYLNMEICRRRRILLEARERDASLAIRPKSHKRISGTGLRSKSNRFHYHSTLRRLHITFHTISTLRPAKILCSNNRIRIFRLVSTRLSDQHKAIRQQKLITEADPRNYGYYRQHALYFYFVSFAIILVFLLKLVR